MTTTIKSTALDFNTIKNNLKTFLAAQDEFTDYEFEASGLSNLLDVLAYNTHYNALIANYALNESFLSTAQLRSSIVSIAESIGYVPGSRTSSRGKVGIRTSLTGANLPTNIVLDQGFKFTSSVDDITYNFQTREDLIAVNDGGGNYQFKTINGSADVTLFEGNLKTKTFLVGENENEIYIIPDKNLDLNTVIVKVFETPSDTNYQIYANIEDATAITSDTQIYVLKETPNGFFELSFGNGNTLGITPVAGNKIEVEYISCSGSVANGAKVFTPSVDLIVLLTDGITNVSATVETVTIANSVGGREKESNESIKKNAPFQYTTQNRMVVAGDYATLIYRNFQQYIQEIEAWGGEDNDPPEYGAVYVSINWVDNLSSEDITNLKISINNYVEQLSIISWNLRFLDPVTTYIETQIFYQYNPKFTTLGLNTVRSLVGDAVDNYFNTTIGQFGQSFRRSNLLAQVDQVDPSVLSSRANVRMQQRLIPQRINSDGTVTNLLGFPSGYLLRFPAGIAAPDDLEYRVFSTLFRHSGKVCFIRNKLNTRVLQVIDNATGYPVIDNVGEYFLDGRFNLTGFAPSSIIDNTNYIKISVVPANQSAISPVRNSILEYDGPASLERPVIVEST